MSNKITKLEKRRFEIIRAIQLCKENKERIARTIINLKSQYKQCAISYADYESKLSSILKQRTPDQWIEYYNNCIEHYKSDLRRYEKEITSEETNIKILPLAIIFMIIFGMGLGLVIFKPEITGFATYNETANITEILNETISNLTLIEDIIGVENVTYIENVTKLSKWYFAEKQDLSEIETAPIIFVNESYSGTDNSILINSSLLTGEYMVAYSAPIRVIKDKYKLTLYYKLLQMGDSIGEMTIDSFNETSLMDSIVIEFNETDAWSHYIENNRISVNKQKEWNKMEIDLNKQTDPTNVRIAISFNMGLDYLPHYYLVSEIEVK